MTEQPTQESIRLVDTAPVERAATEEHQIPKDLRAPELYENRELSWLSFNQRVLELAEDPEIPLLERLRFASIFTSNLDEFFMIRVAGVHDQVDAGIEKRGADGRLPDQVLSAIQERASALSARQTAVVDRDLRPAMEAEGIRIIDWSATSAQQRRALTEQFERQIFGVLTPLAVGIGRPFPYISNLSLSLAVLVRDPANGQVTFARVKVPKEMLPRFVAVEQPGGDDSCAYVPLEQVIAANLDTLFPGMEVIETGVFRVTRDADFEVSDEADDLLMAVEAELRRRRFGEVVRVELDAAMPRELRAALTDALALDPRQVYDVDGLLDAKDLSQLVDLPGYAHLRYKPWTPVTQPRLQSDDGNGDVIGAMRKGDVLVHHPYDSFSTSVERFVEQATNDPDVLAIKMTVYRTSDDSALVPALIRATERGKQAVCLVELKARFDERANIGWARALEEAGVHVVYGHPSLKTHAKCILVVRKEGDGTRNYVHVGTGNYHPKTARLYTDFGLFTTDEQLGADVADMFNFLTGIARPKSWRKALIAPAYLRDGILEEIERTAEAAAQGVSTRIRLKMNSLQDQRCIRALYRASQAGVPIELNLRGICCLVPGVPGVSETIQVTSVVGRFLEHSRIYSFHRGDEQRLLIGSADLMPRNLDQRVELLAPVEDEVLRDDLLDTLDRCFADTANSWDLGSDQVWTRRDPGAEPRSVHRELMLGHAARAAEPA